MRDVLAIRLFDVIADKIVNTKIRGDDGQRDNRDDQRNYLVFKRELGHSTLHP
ncbi:Uncharacterised protein [Vibrio cholerae]|nr:Uncharacterised protein [Vibrio cholerae]CSD16190.1 Uncharacterised protein [Vibrio cholerae]